VDNVCIRQPTTSSQGIITLNWFSRATSA